MSAMKLSGKEYPASEAAVAFLNGYLDRVRRYVETNRLGNDYVRDLENRVAEKLASLGREASEGDAVRIVNELGEPEYIFADVSKSRPSPSGEAQWHKAPFYRDSANGVIFGVCAGLGERFGIDPFYVRVLFIAFFFLFGSSVLVYLLLALIMKDKSWTRLSEEAVGEKVREGTGKFAEAVASVPKTTVNAAVSATRLVGKIVTFFVLALVAGILFGLSVGFFAAFGLSLSGIVISNQELFARVDPALPWAACAAGASAFVLAWSAASKALGRNAFAGWGTGVAGITLAVSLAAGSLGAFRTASEFLLRQTVENRIEIAAGTGEVSLRFDDSERSDNGIRIPNWMEVRFERATDGKFALITQTEISASGKSEAGSLLSKSEPVSVSGSGKSLVVNNAGMEFFEKTPFSFPKRTLVFSVPDGTSVRLHDVPRNARMSSVEHNDVSRYAGSYGCEGGAVKYMPEIGTFGCDPASFSEKAEIPETK